MRRRSAVLLVLTLSASISPLAAAEEIGPTQLPIDWAKELREDIVVTKGKTLVIDDYGLLDFGKAPRRRVHTKWHAEAPAKSFISRDAFVAVFNSMQTMMLLTLVVGEQSVSRADLADFSYEPLTHAASAPVDMDFRFILTKDGVDIAVSTDGLAPKLRTMSWSELYKRRDVQASSAALSMVPAKSVKLPPTCERYLKAFRQCIAEMPEAARELAIGSINVMERDWLAVEDKTSLEPACKEVLDGARGNMGAVCPKVRW